MSLTIRLLRITAVAALVATAVPSQDGPAQVGPAQEDLVGQLMTELRNPVLFDESADKLVRIGAPAVPALLQAWRNRATDPAASVSVDDLPVPVDGVLALEVLARMGPDATSILTELVESVPNTPDHLRGNLLAVIAGIAPYADVDPIELRRLVAEAWKPLKGDEWSTVRGPSGWSTQRSQNWRRGAFRVLNAGLRTQRTLALIDYVVNPRMLPRAEFAAELLGRRGREARNAVPALQNVLRRYYPHSLTAESFALRDAVSKANPRLLDTVADALVAIGPGEGALAWLHRLHDQDPRRRRAAALALGELGPKGATAVPYLTSLSRYGADRAVAADAITALGMLGPLAADAVPALEYLARSDEKEAAQRAAAALRQIRGRHD